MRALTRALVIAIAAGCGGDDGELPPDGGGDGPALELPAVISIPYVPATMGPSSIDVVVRNPGTEDTTAPDGGALAWRMENDTEFSIVQAPDVVPAGGDAIVTIRWAGAAEPRIVGTRLRVESTAGARDPEVWAVAGNPALPPATFTPVAATGRTATSSSPTIGESAVVAMPTAPFPASGRPWTDARVHVFVPAGFRERDAHDVVLHFHGHNTTIDATVPAHRYREQLHASGTNAVLVVPQGPVNAASGDFGKLADPAGTAAFLDEVITVLYRAQKIARPVLGDVVLTSHSGGYQAVALNLDPAATFAVEQVDLFDSLYGYLTTYRDFVVGGRRLRSNYTSGGGTDANNMQLAATLTGAGVAVADAPTTAALRDARAVIYFTTASHNGATRDSGAFGEQLRWSRLAGRRGPRAELRTATATAAGEVVGLTWRSPLDPDLAGWRVEASPDGIAWSLVAQPSADAVAVTFASPAATRVRLVPVIGGVAPVAAADAQPSDTYAVAPGADILVVDGFDRAVDGSWSGLAHDFAARVGAAAGNVHTVSDEAITEDGFALAPYRVVIWLVGDESTDDHTFSPAARAAIDTYLAGGGRVVLSGSEIGYELGPTTAGAAWLASVAGAVYAADDADTTSAAGAGALAAVPSFAFGGAAAPYEEEFADTFTTTGAGAVVLRYTTGGAAAVGIAGRAAIVGFPLEVVEDPAALDAVVDALVTFVGE